MGNIFCKYATLARRLLPLLLVLALATSPVWAAKPADKDQGITVLQALSMALDYSPNIKQVLAELQKAQLQKKEAFTYFLPSLSTNYTWTKNQNPSSFRTQGSLVVVGSENVYQWTTGFKQPLFTGLRLTSQYKLSELGVDLAEVNMTTATMEVALKVKEAYFLYLRAIKGVGVANSAVKRLESQLKVSRDFHEVGIIPVNDVLKVDVELANAMQDRVSAYNNRALSMSRLNRLLGLPVEKELKVADKLGYYPLKVNYIKAREKARVERPELKALNIRLKQADQSILTVESGYYPQISLQGSYFFTGDSPELGESAFYDATDYQIVTQLDWSFWEWGRTKHQAGQVKADKRRLEAVRQDLQDQVDLQVREAVLFLTEAQLNIATATTQIKQAKENYRITFERYQEQLTTNTEVLDAQLLLTQAKVNYYNALTTFNIAEARLKRAMGEGLVQAGAAPDSKM